jgi:hypothetical protein
VTLTWSKPTTNAPPSIAPLTDLAGYKVYRNRGDQPGVWIDLSTRISNNCQTLNADQLTCTDYGPSETGIQAQIYTYYVKAFDSCTTPGPNYSGGSNTFQENESFNPCLDTPQAPAILTGSGGSSSSPGGVILKWSAPTLNDDNTTGYADPGGYNIERCATACTSEANWAQIGSTDSVTLFYPGDGSADLPTNIGSVTYQYRVKAHDTCATGERECPRPSTTGLRRPLGTPESARDHLTAPEPRVSRRTG